MIISSLRGHCAANETGPGKRITGFCCQQQERMQALPEPCRRFTNFSHLPLGRSQPAPVIFLWFHLIRINKCTETKPTYLGDKGLSFIVHHNPNKWVPSYHLHHTTLIFSSLYLVSVLWNGSCKVRPAFETLGNQSVTWWLVILRPCNISTYLVEIFLTETIQTEYDDYDHYHCYILL